MNISKKSSYYLIALYLLLYFIINLNYLEIFPFIHSDEPWLSGLTRNMLETKSIFCTEAFFNLYPRYPHSIKVIFHLIQMPFILIFGYNIFSVRIISLIFSILTLIIFYRISIIILKNYTYGLLVTILFSLNIQFIYASHFARQEIIIVFFFMLCFSYYLSMNNNIIKSKNLCFKPHIILGILIGISIGIHPNSFIIAIVIGLLYVADILRKQKKLNNLIILITTTGIMGLLFVLLSYIGDSNFIKHYTSYGTTLGVTSSLLDKIVNLPEYYKKLYYGISGTYYIPSIKIYLIFFGIFFIISILYLFINFISYNKYKNNISFSQYMLLNLLICIVGINLGFIIIGRYNQTNIIFIFPFFYLLIFLLINKINLYYKRFAYLLIIFLIFITSYFSFKEIKPYTNYSYEKYLKELSVIEPSAKTIGNLNMEFHFQNGSLLDYRNLSYLKENNLSFSDYILLNKIEYIIYTEELDYIHRNPIWNILYGEDTYYEDMNNFIRENCTFIYEFKNSLYGVRIPRYMFDYNWSIKIYKVNLTS
jgi:4-amino-4-deoxy-L-arabinose transferase-like glycosyltransferase